jgi:hypothetical protein
MRAACSSHRYPSASQTTPTGSASSRRPQLQAKATQIRELPASSHCPLAWRGWAWPGPNDPPPATSTLYVTNVPGPASTLYFAGARLLQAVPLAPLVAGVRLSVTALSYDGQFAVSLLADDNMPDLPVLAGGMCAAFDGYLNTDRKPSGRHRVAST